MARHFLFAITALLATTTLLTLSGCSKEEDPTNEPPFRLESNLLMSSSLFENVLTGQDTKPSFEILDVTRDGNSLHVEIKGSGNEDAYQFIWDGRVQESYPMGVRLMLHNLCEDCDASSKKELSLSVNLQKIIGERNNLDDYNFYVINASTVETVTLNPDGTTSGIN